MSRKRLTKPERNDEKTRLNQLKMEIMDANFTRMRQPDDPLFAASESSFRRGFAEALHYVGLFIDLSPKDRIQVNAFLKQVLRWKQRLAENGKQSFPPVPKTLYAEKMLRLNVKPNPRKKR